MGEAILYRDPEYGAVALVQEGATFTLIDHGSIDADKARDAIAKDAEPIGEGKWRPKVRPEVLLSNFANAMQEMGYTEDRLGDRAILVVEEGAARAPDLPADGRVRVSEAVERAIVAQLDAAVARARPNLPGPVKDTCLEAYPRPNARYGPASVPLPFFVARAVVEARAPEGVHRVTEGAGNWLNDLDPRVKQDVFAWMRKVNEESSRYHREATRLSGGGLSVGSGAFDYVMKAEARRVFLSRLRRGDDPKEALDATLAELRKYVEKHNAKRPREYTWQRGRDFGSDIAYYLYRSLMLQLPEPEEPKGDALSRAWADLDRLAKTPGSGVYYWESVWRKALEPMGESVVRATATVRDPYVLVLEAAVRPPAAMLEAFDGAALPAFENHPVRGYREAHIHLGHAMRKDALKVLRERAAACAAALCVESIEDGVLRVMVPSSVEGHHLGDQAFRERVNWLMMEAYECDPVLEWVGTMQDGVPAEDGVR